MVKFQPNFQTKKIDVCRRTNSRKCAIPESVIFNRFDRKSRFRLIVFGEHFYRPQTKLREGDVFTPVCDSAYMGEGMHGEGGTCMVRGCVRGEGGVHGEGEHAW